ADPPVALALQESSRAGLSHLGIRVGSTEEVEASSRRLLEEGLATFDERDTTCCYARQDKVWVSDPAGNRREVYTVLEDEEEAAGGTPVYAVRAGTVFLHQDGLGIRTNRGAEIFGYWHVVPVVREHELVKLHQEVATVKAEWGHLHFADRIHGKYVNPLRPDG